MEAFLERYILPRGIPADLKKAGELPYLLEWGVPQSSSIEFARSSLERILPEIRYHLLEWDCGLVLIPSGWKLTDVSFCSDLRGEKTLDGRDWDYVGGCCRGPVALAGEEPIYRCYHRLKFNLLMHEVAHQIHLNVFSKSDALDIEQLYQRAKLDGRCLDFYAENNVFEYFAQGFCSMNNTIKTDFYANHTASELCLKDHGLYNFCRRFLR